MVKTYRLTFAKADTDVTLEFNTATAWELKGVEMCHEKPIFSIDFPVTKYRRICGAAIFVCYEVFILSISIHGLGYTVTSESSVDRGWLDIYSEDKGITDFC